MTDGTTEPTDHAPARARGRPRDVRAVPVHRRRRDPHRVPQGHRAGGRRDHRDAGHLADGARVRRPRRRARLHRGAPRPVRRGGQGPDRRATRSRSPATASSRWAARASAASSRSWPRASRRRSCRGCAPSPTQEHERAGGPGVGVVGHVLHGRVRAGDGRRRPRARTGDVAAVAAVPDRRVAQGERRHERRRPRDREGPLRRRGPARARPALRRRPVRAARAVRVPEGAARRRLRGRRAAPGGRSPRRPARQAPLGAHRRPHRRARRADPRRARPGARAVPLQARRRPHREVDRGRHPRPVGTRRADHGREQRDRLRGGTRARRARRHGGAGVPEPEPRPTTRSRRSPPPRRPPTCRCSSSTSPTSTR